MEPEGPFRPDCLHRSDASDCCDEDWCALHDSTTLAASRRRAARDRLERATSWSSGRAGSYLRRTRIATSPRLLILDESLAQFDPPTGDLVLSAISKRPHAVLLVSH